LLVEPVQLISFIMSQRMLHGIKHRAERTVACICEPQAGVPAK
jgi:hypothetical protein